MSFTDGARQLLGFELGPNQRFDARFAVMHLGGVCVSLHDGWGALLGGTLPVLPSADRAQPCRGGGGEDSISTLVTDISQCRLFVLMHHATGFSCKFCSTFLCMQPTYFSQLPFLFCQSLSNIRALSIPTKSAFFSFIKLA